MICRFAILLPTLMIFFYQYYTSSTQLSCKFSNFQSK
nr:MAG TPA: hypothetical protein [Caudoviricetes sp.]